MSDMPVPAPSRVRGSAPGSRLLGASGARSVESLALVCASACFVLAGFAALLAFRLEPAPIAGPGSIGQFAAFAAALAALVAFVAGRAVVQKRRNRPALRLLDYLDIAALAFAHAVIALLAGTLLAAILDRSFVGAEVFPVPVILLTAAAAAIAGYVAFVSAARMDLDRLALVLAAFLVLGILASMLAASDPDWWKDNLSALGTTTNVSARAFNLTLIVGGFIITTLARYATRDIPTPHPGGVRGMRTCLILVGIFLALVGVFPVDIFFFVHTAVTIGMVVAFAVMVVRLPVWIPGMPRGFVTLGWIFLGVTVALVALFLVGYYTLTAAELVAAVLVFTWLILFIRNAAALREDVGAAAAR